MSASHQFPKVMRPGALAKPRKLYILIMGLTGAGKSTFIYTLTGNTNIPIYDASQMRRGINSFPHQLLMCLLLCILVTTEVQDYILDYQLDGRYYEVHLIDTPGFDDDYGADAEILSNIADYVNTIYLLKDRLAGVLYLHDITKARMGGVGLRNIRMLEDMIGREQFDKCTIVTTKWGCTSNPRDEEQRERTLRTDQEFFGSMLTGESLQSTADFRRFDPKSPSDPGSKIKALELIKPFMNRKFTTNISKQMVAPMGPKLSLGETGAGKVVANNVEKLAKAKLKLAQSESEKEKLMAAHSSAQALLAQKYDETLFAEFIQKRKKLRRQIRRQRCGRWIMRTTIIGGAIVATVLTLGPGASAFILEPTYEKAVKGQRRAEKQAKVDLEMEFKSKSKDGNYLKAANPQWLWDSKVKEMQDLDAEGYSIKSRNSDDLYGIAKRGETVGFATEGEVGGVGSTRTGKEKDWKSDSTSDEDDLDMSDSNY